MTKATYNSRKEAQNNSWFSRRHQTSKEHDLAKEINRKNSRRGYLKKDK